MIFYNESLYSREYSIYHLRDQTYEQIKDTNFRNVKGLQSPNHLWGVGTTKHSYEVPYKIILFNKDNNDEIIIHDAGHGTTLSHYSSNIPEVALFWVDNENFLYAYFSKPKYIGPKNYDPNKISLLLTDTEDIISSITIYKVNIGTKDPFLLLKSTRFMLQYQMHVFIMTRIIK